MNKMPNDAKGRVNKTRNKEKETMSEETNFTVRLSKAAKEFNVGKDTIVEFLTKKGFQVDPSPNTKLTAEMYDLLVKEYQGEKEVKNEAKKLRNLSYKGGSVSVESALQSPKTEDEEDHDEVIIRTNTISSPVKKTATKTSAEPEPVKEPETAPKEETPEQVVEAPAQEVKAETPAPAAEETKEKEDNKEEKADTGISLKILGQIDLDQKPKRDKDKKEEPKAEKPKQPQAKPNEPSPAKPKEQKPAKPKEQKQPAKPKEQKPVVKQEVPEEKIAEPRRIKLEAPKLQGPTVLGMVELPDEKRRTKASPESRKKKRKRIFICKTSIIYIKYNLFLLYRLLPQIILLNKC